MIGDAVVSRRASRRKGIWLCRIFDEGWLDVCESMYAIGDTEICMNVFAVIRGVIKF